MAKFTESRTETASHHMDDVMGTTINGPSYGHVLQDSKKTLAQIESAKKYAFLASFFKGRDRGRVKRHELSL